VTTVILILLGALGLYTYGPGVSSPSQNLRWDSVTVNCDGSDLVGAVQYQVFAVKGTGPIPTKIVHGPCGPVLVPDGVPVSVSNKPTVKWTRKGKWTIGVQAVVDKTPSGLSQTITVNRR